MKPLLVALLFAITAACSSKGADAGASELPSECTAYSQVVDKVAACDQMTSTRDLFLKRREQNLQRWKATLENMPQGRDVIAKSCENQRSALATALPAACR